ncbi:NAD(P)-dependent oxidoreductase [Brachybacterium sacelli]|uniref:Phosphoglycerate dehydrogenase-like enzyme n=1 Tax=Brachybacterium sacelli TaxID=173364 RepID=A0ABS4WXH2_9MICO|nr:NAD(P)-dependent oxidoreductase [Brachybacterium sacelli]MBP2380897.1 phosphoglycerate dehydrogenase-like enzyme [Brachybacterium sacelli]
MSAPWKLAVTADYAEADGSTIYGDIGLGTLAEHDIEWSLVGDGERELRGDELEGFDAVVLLSGTPFGRAQLEGVTTLKHVARFGAGFDSVDLAACDTRGITVTNAPTGLRVPMAHTALTFLFALAHSLLPKDRLVREAAWERKAEHRGPGLASATIGVVGLGGIGQETVRQLRALDLAVIAWNRSPRPEFCVETGIEQLAFEEVIARSDCLIVTVAANAGTRHLIGARELAAMKDSAFLINIARGAVVDEPALVTALNEGTIAGAGLDVFEVEPLPADSPLIALENVVLSPHSLCWTADFAEATGAEVLGEVIAMAQGTAPSHVVNAPEDRPGHE